MVAYVAPLRVDQDVPGGRGAGRSASAAGEGGGSSLQAAAVWPLAGLARGRSKGAKVLSSRRRDRRGRRHAATARQACTQSTAACHAAAARTHHLYSPTSNCVLRSSRLLICENDSIRHVNLPNSSLGGLSARGGGVPAHRERAPHARRRVPCWVRGARGNQPRAPLQSHPGQKPTGLQRDRLHTQRRGGGPPLQQQPTIGVVEEAAAVSDAVQNGGLATPVCIRRCG